MKQIMDLLEMFGADPEECHENNQRGRKLLLQRKADVAVVQPGEVEAPGRLYCGLSELKGRL